MTPDERKLEELARLVAATQDCELNCSEFLDLAAAYLKATTAPQTLTDELRKAAQHLDICPECREEFAALVRAEGLDPDATRDPRNGQS